MFFVIDALMEKLLRLIVILEKNRFGAAVLSVLVLTILALFSLYVYFELSSKSLIA
jgi:uncharacterized membrane protein